MRNSMQQKTNKFMSLASKSALTLALVVGLGANASFAKGEHWNLGLAYGQSNLSPESNSFSLDDDKDSGYKVSLGYQFDKNWGAEGFYSDLGTVTLSNNLTPSDIRSIDYSVYGVGATYTFHLDDNPTFEFLVRGGYASVSTDSADLTLEDDSTDGFYFGAGIGYELARDWDLTLNYDVYSDDSEMVSLGVNFRF